MSEGGAGRSPVDTSVRVDNEIIQSRIWDFIHHQFTDNENCLVRHHIDSYNDFYKRGIQQIFRDNNPLVLPSGDLQPNGEYTHLCNIYMGGRDGSAIYYGKPVIYESNAGNIMGSNHYMFPNEARLRNMSYSMAIHIDVEVEIVSHGAVGDVDGWERIKVDDQTGGKRVSIIAPIVPGTAEKTILRRILPKIYLGKYPVMLQSDFCILRGMPREMRYNSGECRNDPGGYFIIDGKEKVIISQEKFADNALYVHNHRRDLKEMEDDEEVAETTSLKPYLTTAEIRSVSENPMKPIRKSAVHMLAPTSSLGNRNIVVEIPNVRQPVPLFIVFRALGVISDKAIIEMCLLDLDKYESMLDLFIPSVYDAGPIYTQYAAIQYITALTKYDTSPEYTMEILCDYFLPHVGETNFVEKAYYLGYMVFRLLAVHTGLEEPVDRDHYKHKRLELTGTLLYDLFREYYRIQCDDHIMKTFEKRLYYNQDMYRDHLPKLIDDNFKDAFRERAVESGFAKAYKGSWGATSHTKRVATIQDLDRISFHSIICHLRKTNLPLDSTSKVVGPRLLHSSQWGIVDPVDTPDGGNIGLLKTLSLSVVVSTGYSREQMIQWLRKHNSEFKFEFSNLVEHSPKYLSNKTKVVINGYWAGVVGNPRETVDTIIRFRRFALIPTFTSATFDIRMNTVFIYTDAGRLCRPTFHCKARKSGEIVASLERRSGFPSSWNDMVMGTLPGDKSKLLDALPRIYELAELYGDGVSMENLVHDKEAIVDFMDSSETENALIAMDVNQLHRESKTRKFTHMEIHDSLIFGYMCNHSIFPENNPVARNQFSCSQSRQAVSVYNSNYSNRMDKTAIVLTYGQIPLLKSRYLKYFSREEHPYGVNAIVAIMCYTGYNVEDAILLNEASVKRGLFQTNYYNTYYAYEESEEESQVRFTNIDAHPEIVGTQPKADYSKLDEYGLITENTPVDENTVVIGLSTYTTEPGASPRDASITPKKGQIGVVDKVFLTDDEEGKRLAKVRVRELRRPMLGDKMASRAGQKGTCGNIIPERDMPFTKDGLRPDLIINPHAIPTRMTIGQFVECIMGKVCVQQGAFGDCTAFNNKSTDPLVEFGKELTKYGYHSQGDEVMYNGMTGEQLESSIFIGPTYYMRLKHMVKDKVNFRGQGPNTSLTRQPVSGRANDGGLRIGEMERDVLVSHGIQAFLQDSMMNRSDDYYFAVCNTTGMMAIYNPAKNLFMSPAADGPIKFKTSNLGEDENAPGDVLVDRITRFGRDFSIVRVPYSFKLLMQELQTINVQMRIITEDNIEQFEALNLKLPEDIAELIHKKEPKEQEKELEKEQQEEEQEQEAEEPEYLPPVREGNKPLYERDNTPPSEEEVAARISQIDPKKVGVVKMHWRGDDTKEKHLYDVITTSVKSGNVVIMRGSLTIKGVSLLKDLYLPSEYDTVYHPKNPVSYISFKWDKPATEKPEWAKTVQRWHIIEWEPKPNGKLIIVPDSTFIDNMETIDTMNISYTPEFKHVRVSLDELDSLYPSGYSRGNRPKPYIPLRPKLVEEQEGEEQEEEVQKEVQFERLEVPEFWDEDDYLEAAEKKQMEEEGSEEEEVPTKGGKKQSRTQKNTWKPDDIVYYREDFAKPSRMWTVKHVSDDGHFITIDTPDLDGIGVEDSVRIVYPSMLYDNKELISFEDLLGQTQLDTVGKVPGCIPAAQPQLQQVQQQPPPVNVVVVSGDNSVGIQPGQAPTQPQMIPEIPDFGPAVPSIIPLEQEKVVQAPNDNLTGNIDFNSFVIKKVG